MAEKKFLSAISVDATEDYGTLVDNIIEARKSRGFSQREMADRCLMSLSTYQSIESAQLTVSVGALLSVLDILEQTQTLRDVAAPHLDTHGRALRMKRRP